MHAYVDCGRRLIQYSTSDAIAASAPPPLVKPVQLQGLYTCMRRQSILLLVECINAKLNEY